MVTINFILATLAFCVVFLAFRKGGARVYVNLYALGVILWGLCCFGGVAAGIIAEDRLPGLMRPVWALVYIWVIIAYVTDRRGKNG